MNFTPIVDLNLDLTINLNALTRASQPYKVLMYQHEGKLIATEERIGNETNPKEEFLAFFKKAKEAPEPDLVLTPEYSCPWSMLDKIVADNALWPSHGKLWVIGSESISPAALNDFKIKFSMPNILVQYEDEINNSNKKYVDPTVYLFRVTHTNEEKLMVLIQFKTHHMGVWGGALQEHDYLIQGRKIYILENSDDQPSISFVTLICSEAMNFPQNVPLIRDFQKTWDDKPFLIFHPQCNPKPQHADFIAFRKFVFENDNKEIIALNWHTNSKFGNALIFNESPPRSGFALKSNDIQGTELSRVKRNHLLGMYYFNLDKHRHSFLLSGLIHLYVIDMPAVKITGVRQPQSIRNGPKIENIFIWNKDLKLFENKLDGISDGHIDYIKGIGCTNHFLIETQNCIFEKERLVSLTSGEFKSKISWDWFHLNHLYSVFMDENNETSRRVSYIEEKVVDSQDEISRYVKALVELEHNILKNDQNIPESVADLRAQGVSIGYNSFAVDNFYRYNVLRADGNPVNATFLYLDIRSPEDANKRFSNFRSVLEYSNKGRLVVYYRVGPKLCWVVDMNAGKITYNDQESPESILKS